jgi:hypothetical protein
MTELEFHKLLQNLKDIQQQHLASTESMDEYFMGMFNGMEIFLSIIEKREPKFADGSREGSAP